MAHTRDDFSRALLERMGLRPSRRRRIALVAWMTAENTKARFNPLATTRTAPGSTDYNDNEPPVQNYISFRQGVDATYDTIALPYYADVRRALDGRASPRRILEAVGASPWAGASKTYAGLLLQCLDEVEGNYDEYGSILIGS